MHFVAWWQRNRLLFSFYSFKKTAVFCVLHLIKHSPLSLIISSFQNFQHQYPYIWNEKH